MGRSYSPKMLTLVVLKRCVCSFRLHNLFDLRSSMHPYPKNINGCDGLCAVTNTGCVWERCGKQARGRKKKKKPASPSTGSFLDFLKGSTLTPVIKSWPSSRHWGFRITYNVLSEMGHGQGREESRDDIVIARISQMTVSSYRVITSCDFESNAALSSVYYGLR